MSHRGVTQREKGFKGSGYPGDPREWFDSRPLFGMVFGVITVLPLESDVETIGARAAGAFARGYADAWQPLALQEAWLR